MFIQFQFIHSPLQGLMMLIQNLPTHHWTGTEIGLLLAEAYKLKFMFADAPKHLVNKQ